VKLIVGVHVGREILSAIENARKRIWISSPYVSIELIEKLPRVDDGRVLVSESLDDERIPTVAKIRGYRVRALEGLHAKIYVADDIAAVGSPNFTLWGLHANYEAAVIACEGEELYSEIVAAFEGLWRIGRDL